jgi:hypothetical protein
MFLSDLRQLAMQNGLTENRCRVCPAEDWAPVCPACGGSARVWVGNHGVLSDDQLAALRREATAHA